LDFKEEIDLTTNEINIMKTINNAIDNLNYQIINNYFDKLNNKDIKINNIKDNIKKLKVIQKSEENYFNIKPRMLKTFYCKKCNFKNYDIKRLIQLFSVYLYYKEILENNNENMSEVYNYIKNI